jgi:hypothetical protein
MGIKYTNEDRSVGMVDDRAEPKQTAGRELESLHKDLSGALGDLDHLAARLEPILAPEESGTDHDEPGPDGGASEIINAIRTARREVSAIQRRIAVLNGRLQL